MKTIEITITTNGQTIAETKGFEGSSCRQASEFLSKALGQQKSEQLTSEFYTHQNASQDAQEGHEASDYYSSHLRAGPS